MTLTEVVLALGLFGMVIGAILTGLIQTNYRAGWSVANDAATKLAEHRMEQVMNARWEPTASPTMDQVVATNFPNDVVNLDLNSVGGIPFTGNRSVSITPVPATGTPLYKAVRVQVVWSYRGRGPFTNNVTSIRSPDQ